MPRLAILIAALWIPLLAFAPFAGAQQDSNPKGGASQDESADSATDSDTDEEAADTADEPPKEMPETAANEDQSESAAAKSEPAKEAEPEEKAKQADEAEMAEEEPRPSAEAQPTPAELQLSPGQEALDEATGLKISARGLRDLNRVVELLDEALEAGLDEANTDFAEQMLVATLMQRATSMSAAVLDRPISDPRRDPRWIQVRQFALTDLQRAVAIDDDLAEAHLLIGRLQSLPLGDPNAARRALTKVIQSESESVSDDQLAQAYALRGATQTDPDKQVADFGRAVELMPGKAEFQLLRARGLARSEDLEGALSAVEKAEEISPDNPAVFEQKALLLRQLERLEDAIAALDKATELSPELLRPYSMRAEIYAQLDQLDNAIAEIDLALEKAPTKLELLLVRAELYRAAERYEEALTDIEALLKRQPAFIDGHLLRTVLLDQLGRSEIAVATLEQLAAAAPNEPKIQLQLAGLYMSAERITDAINALTKVLEVAADNQMALRLRGDMYLSTGKHEEALADFEKSYELNPGDQGLLNNFAWTLATSPFDELRDGERAIELATAACELTEYKQAHILSTLAAAYAESGDFERAIEWSQKAVEVHANDENKSRDMTAELAAELASYQEGRPWRELQQEGDRSPSQEEAAESAPGAQVETLDF